MWAHLSVTSLLFRFLDLDWGRLGTRPGDCSRRGGGDEDATAPRRGSGVRPPPQTLLAAAAARARCARGWRRPPPRSV
uniref:Uncharacterized protein n=1 Tax=Setaria viridis TaxID=4556 RepID=A0A4U6U6P1_SETVI|nr:hypothetical protein SEVIR_6G065875v2 [Setaria viridis]